MFDLKACRSCLSTTGRLEKLTQASKRIYTALTGLEIKEDNIYPLYFCEECRGSIKKSLVYMRRAKRAYYVLQEILIVKKQITQQQLANVDRNKTNLASFITTWNPSKIGCYSFEENDTDNQESSDKDKNKISSAETSKLNKYVPKISESGTINVVDIKSADYVEDSELKKFWSEVNLDEEQENDTQNFDLQYDSNIPEDVDMEDLFKDLSDDEVDDEIEENAPDLFEMAFEVMKKRKLRSTKAENNLLKAKITVLKDAICNAKIKVMDEEGQMKNLRKRQSQSKFVKAVYKCFVCVSQFETKMDLLHHLKEHNEKRAKFEYICKICKDKFETCDDLSRHTAEEHLYEYTCNFCAEISYSLDDLLEHFEIHKEKPSSLSEDIKTNYRVKFLKPEEMWLTITPNNDIQESGPFFCKTCSIGLASKYANEHWHRHSEDSIVGVFKAQCEHCKLWFGTKASINNHMDMYHRYKYHCKQCKVVAYTQRHALVHRKTHLQKNKKKTNYKCNLCTYEANSFRELAAHKEDVHSVCSMNHCNICGDTFKFFNLLVDHQLRSHNYLSITDPLIGDPNISCSHCNIRFVSKSALDNHCIKMDHAEAKNIDNACMICRELFDSVEERNEHRCKEAKFPAQCPYCTEVLSTYLLYKKHIFHEHPGQKYKRLNGYGFRLCEVCGESVKIKHMDVHVKQHTDKLLSCPYCPLKMDTLTLCAIHVISNHQYNPYICAICHRRFKARATCRDHILKVHSTVNYYPCDICGLKFQHFDFVIEHSKKMHKKDVSKLKCRANINRFQFFVYPDMKVDVSLLPDEMLGQIKGGLVDYFDETKTEALSNLEDYFVKRTVPLEDLVVKMKKRKLRVEKKKEIVAEDTTTKLNDKCSLVEKDGVQYVDVGGTRYKVEIF